MFFSPTNQLIATIDPLAKPDTLHLMLSKPLKHAEFLHKRPVLLLGSRDYPQGLHGTGHTDWQSPALGRRQEGPCHMKGFSMLGCLEGKCVTISPEGSQREEVCPQDYFWW